MQGLSLAVFVAVIFVVVKAVKNGCVLWGE